MLGAFAIFSLVFGSLATCSVWPAELGCLLFFPQKYFNFSTKAGNKAGWGHYWCTSRGRPVGDMWLSGECEHIWLTRPGIRSSSQHTNLHRDLLPGVATQPALSCRWFLQHLYHACNQGTCMFSGYIPPKLCPWLVAFPPLSCDIPLIYTNPLPPLSLCNFCPLQGRECVSAFCLAESLNSNFFIILFCKRQTFPSNAFQLSSNRSFKTMSNHSGSFFLSVASGIPDLQKQAMQCKFLVVNKFVHGKCGLTPHRAGAVVSPHRMLPCCDIEAMVSRLPRPYFFFWVHKCWLYVLGSLKTFLFPSCCAEWFCSFVC